MRSLRIARRGAAVALALMGVTLMAAAPRTGADYVPGMLLQLFDSGLGKGSIGVLTDDPAGFHVTVQRDGETIVDSDPRTPYRTGIRLWLPLDPLPGDVIEVRPRGTYVYLGRPTLGSCPTGQRSVDVRTAPGAGMAGSSDSISLGTLSVGPRGTGTVYLPRPLRASDVLTLTSVRRFGDLDVEIYTSRKAGHCDGPVIAPRSTGDEGRTFLHGAALVETRPGPSSAGVVAVPIGCDRYSRVGCRGELRLETVPPNGEPVTELGYVSIDLAKGEEAKVGVILFESDPGAVPGTRTLPVRAVTETRDPTGALIVRSRVYTLVHEPDTWPGIAASSAHDRPAASAGPRNRPGAVLD